MTTGPREFAEGLTIGAGTLVRSVGGGLLNMVTQLTGTVSRGLAEASLDSKFQHQRLGRQSAPGHPKQGGGRAHSRHCIG